MIVIYLVRRQYYWMAAESDLSSPLAGCHGCTNKKADQATESLRKLKLVRELKWRWKEGDLGEEGLNSQIGRTGIELLQGSNIFWAKTYACGQVLRFCDICSKRKPFA